MLKLLVDRSGLVPPSECTITTHELLHVVDQSIAIGCPRYSNLYKFEKVNKFFKSMLNNVSKSMASIMKNYMQIESIFLETALNLEERYEVQNIQKFLPKELKAMKNINSYLQKIHIDIDDKNSAEIIDIDSSNILHLYGERKLEKLNILLFSYILHNTMEYPAVTAPEDSLLKRLFDEWKSGNGSKKPEGFFNFLKKSFNKYTPMTNHSVYSRYNKLILNMSDLMMQDKFRDDFEFLAKCFSPAVEDELFPDDHLLITYVISRYYDILSM